MIPSALDHVREIVGDCGRLAVFLDYDGTLTPIVSDPEEALLSDSMRQTLLALAAQAPVAILSGRDLDDICQRVDIGTVIYGGSHGFDIAGPRGLHKQVGAEFLPALDAAENALRKMLACIPGALVERKRFSVAAHYRNVDKSDVIKTERIVNQVAAHHRKLRRIANKKVYELQPDIDWDKGKAVLWLLEALGLEQDDVRPVYIGDDRTDEDAFRALEQRGVGILVGEQPRRTAGGYSLKNTAEVEHFLRALISSLT